jgi:hypothetical protein
VSARRIDDIVRRIADAVLYEGYVLWPYRSTALKNQRRWTFGGVHPAAHARAHPDDRALMRAECVLEGGPQTEVDVEVRFLHVVRRDVAELRADGPHRVAELRAGNRVHVAWDEAAEREVAVRDARLAAGGPWRAAMLIEAGSETEEVRDDQGRRAGLLIRSWERLEGVVEVAATTLAPGVFRLAATVANTTDWDGGPREEVLRRTLCSTHAVLRVRGGAFVSSTDPPARLRAAVDGCRNEGAWPVLVGEPGSRDTVLASPIILEDHPRIAPESPGDLFDGGEIDQLLTLSILAMTDDEKERMRACDPRTRAILERTESLSRDQLMRLHGYRVER